MNKLKIKYLGKILTFFSIVITLVLASCNNDETTSKGTPYDPGKPITITKFDPDSGGIRKTVLIDGSNFGNNLNDIRVFFNHAEAKVIGINETGTTLKTLVPRLPGDECIIKVLIGGTKQEDGTWTGGKSSNVLSKLFRYKVAATITTVAGNGSKDPRIYDQGLDKAQFWPVYIAMDSNDNLFVNSDDNNFLRLNVEQNLITIIANGNDHLYQNNCSPTVHPYTDVIMVGANSSDPRDRFLFLDPRDGWAPKPQYIRTWKTYPEDEIPTYVNTVNGAESRYDAYAQPGTGNGHFYCLWSEYPKRVEDEGKANKDKFGWYYTRYHDGGQIVRVDPLKWEATIIGLTPSGTNYSAAINPIRPWEMWIGAGSEGNSAADWNNSICVFRLDGMPAVREDGSFNTDPGVAFGVGAYDFTPVVAGNGTQTRGISKSAIKLSSPVIRGSHRDGEIRDAEFNRIRQLGFDSDGNLFVGDCENQCLRQITTMTDPIMVTTVIGIPGKKGWVDGSPDVALFRQLHGIVTDKEGVIYVSDWDNGRIRRIAIE